jgi:hypothetical protein
MAVSLGLYVGEDWVQQLSFFIDPVSDPQTFNDPMALTHPFMQIRPQRSTGLLATLVTTDPDPATQGSLVISGGSSNILTATLPHALTKTLQAQGTVRFDIFDDIGGVRVCILKAGLIEVTDSISDMP